MTSPREPREGSQRREQLAWAAGFFEGEGCFSSAFQPKRSGDGGKLAYAVTSLRQKDRDLLERFRDIVGFGGIYGPYGGTDVSSWQAQKRGDVQRLVDLLGEWLSPRRLTKAAECLRLEGESRLQPARWSK